MSGYDTGGYGLGFYGGTNASWPNLLVEIDITNKPTAAIALADRTWTDITNYVRAGNWTRAGRAAETERTQGGNCLLTLDNRPNAITGEPFDKDNASSPFNASGGLSWSFLVRISLVYDGIVYTRWTGTKETLRKDRPGYGKDRTATLSGVDLMKALELFPLSGLDLALGTANTRVTGILAAGSFAAGTIDSATVSTLTFPEAVFTSDDTTSALAHLQQVEQDERGLIFAAADGGIDFQGRFYRADKVLAGAAGTIGEVEGNLRYVNGAPSDDNSYLWNIVAVTPAGGGTVQIAASSESAARNYQRRLDLTMLVEDEPSALANAQWYVNRFAEPPQRLPQLEILGGRDPSTWSTILSAGNSDPFTWNGGNSTMSVFLERVSESFSVAPNEPRVRVFWDTSPSSRDRVWKLGVPGASELGVTTRLG